MTNMKTIIITLGWVTLLALTSCSSESEDPKPFVDCAALKSQVDNAKMAHANFSSTANPNATPQAKEEWMAQFNKLRDAYVALYQQYERDCMN